MSKLEILYEDNHIIAINKRSGILVQGDKTGDIPLVDSIKEYIKEKYQKPGAVFLGVVHRIDRPVSGIVLFARTSKALERLNELFKERQMQKTYLAIVREKPKQDSSELIHWLVKNTKTNVTKAYDYEIKNGLKSILRYQVLTILNGYYLIEVNPVTGRPHQIRVQLSSIGCPIVGDNKYGYPRGNKDKSICLHAYKLSFTHPIKKEFIELCAELPTDNFWQKFKSYVT